VDESLCSIVIPFSAVYSRRSLTPTCLGVERILQEIPQANQGGRVVEIDPVCGMEVDPSTAEWSYEHEGTTYYFCSKGCMDDFIEDPASYLG
jgi:YHS domain-containing protein